MTYSREILERAARGTLPEVPAGQDPLTYQREDVGELLAKAAYFTIFSLHPPGVVNPAVSLPFCPLALVEVFVEEQLHRFAMQVDPPTAAEGLRAFGIVGQEAAQINMIWSPFGDDYDPSPDTVPPLTPLQPWRSQGFTLQNGLFQFLDPQQSGFQGFGVGRTFPALENYKPVLRVGGVIEILNGLGKIQGHAGAMMVNGFIVPPQGLALSIVVRVMDPDGQLRAGSKKDIPPLEPVPNPDPSATFLNFMVEPRDVALVSLDIRDGELKGWTMKESLRLVRSGFGVRGPKGLRSLTETGEIAGTVTSEVVVESFDPTRGVFPIRTKNQIFTIMDQAGAIVGTLEADMVEGFAFPTELEGRQVFRTTGFGPFEKGTGQFKSMKGMMSWNGATSVFPFANTGMYLLRIYDPAGDFSAPVPSRWHI